MFSGASHDHLIPGSCRSGRQTLADLSQLTAVILAGGRGTRLRPVIGHRQKVVAEVAGKPFILYLLERLTRIGVKHVVVCCSFRSDMVTKCLASWFAKVQLDIVQEPKPLGTAGALKNALARIHSDPFLVLNGDSFCDVDLAALCQAHLAMGATDSMVLTACDDTSRYGRVLTDDKGWIQCFEEKRGDAGSGWINAGVYLLSRECIQTVPSGQNVSIEREVFPDRIGQKFLAFFNEGRFIDIGTPQSFQRAQALFSN